MHEDQGRSGARFSKRRSPDIDIHAYLLWKHGNITQNALGRSGNSNTRMKIVGGVHSQY
jgi:hypothetical protein